MNIEVVDTQTNYSLCVKNIGIYNSYIIIKPISIKFKTINGYRTSIDNSIPDDYEQAQYFIQSTRTPTSTPSFSYIFYPVLYNLSINLGDSTIHNITNRIIDSSDHPAKNNDLYNVLYTTTTDMNSTGVNASIKIRAWKSSGFLYFFLAKPGILDTSVKTGDSFKMDNGLLQTGCLFYTTTVRNTENTILSYENNVDIEGTLLHGLKEHTTVSFFIQTGYLIPAGSTFGYIFELNVTETEKSLIAYNQTLIIY